MIRRLIAVFALLSVLVWALILAAWISSRQQVGCVWVGGGGRMITFSWFEFGPMVHYFNGWSPDRQIGWAFMSRDQGLLLPLMEAHGPGAAFSSNGRYWDFQPNSGRIYVQPDPAGPASPYPVLMFGLGIDNWWLPLTASWVLPAAWLWMVIRHIRRQKYRRLNKLCLTCGYDLRASKDKCPECGAIIPPAGINHPSRNEETKEKASPPIGGIEP